MKKMTKRYIKNIEARLFQKEYDSAKLKQLKEERKKLLKALNDINSQILELGKYDHPKNIRGSYLMSDQILLKPMEIKAIRENRFK